MKTRGIVSIFTLFCLFGYSSALASDQGGLFVEPGISYEMGDSKIDYPSPLSNSSGSVNGFGLYGRMGFHVSEVFFTALDARYKMVRFKDSSNNYSADATGYDLAPVIGVQMPNFGLRVWAGYVLAGMLDPKADGPIDVKFEEANGLRVGAGLRLGAVSLNLEYQDLKYGKTVLEQLGPFTSAGQSDSIRLANKSYLLSLSFPLEI